MKTFDDLTLDQKLEAYKYARTTLESTLSETVVETAIPMSLEEIKELAEEIAENGTYTDDGRPYVGEMHVPYYFLGGCI